MTKRIDQLDGVRAIAIAAVFIHHSLGTKMLWTGVDLFFILSGFLITGILIKAREQPLKHFFGHFYKRRALRILPPYALLLVITTVIFGAAWAAHWYLYLFLMNFLVALGIAHPLSLSVLWSLAVEEQFYLIWPFIIYFFRERTVAWIAGAIILVVPVLRSVCAPLFLYHWPIYVLTPFRMDLLAAGALLSIVWRHRPDAIRRFGSYGLVASLLAVLVLVALSRNPKFSTTANTPFSSVWIYELSLIACTGVILWALSGRGVGILRLPPVVFLGRISYSIYLIHLTVIELCGRFFHRPFEVVVIAAGVTLLYATLSWFLMEKPLIEVQPRPSPIPASV